MGSGTYPVLDLSVKDGRWTLQGMSIFSYFITGSSIRPRHIECRGCWAPTGLGLATLNRPESQVHHVGPACLASSSPHSLIGINLLWSLPTKACSNSSTRLGPCAATIDGSSSVGPLNTQSWLFHHLSNLFLTYCPGADRHSPLVRLDWHPLNPGETTRSMKPTGKLGQDCFDPWIPERLWRASGISFLLTIWIPVETCSVHGIITSTPGPLAHPTRPRHHIHATHILRNSSDRPWAHIILHVPPLNMWNWPERRSSSTGPVPVSHPSCPFRLLRSLKSAATQGRHNS